MNRWKIGIKSHRISRNIRNFVQICLEKCQEKFRIISRNWGHFRMAYETQKNVRNIRNFEYAKCRKHPNPIAIGPGFTTLLNSPSTTLNWRCWKGTELKIETHLFSFLLGAVLGIRDILMRVRIRIRGSILLSSVTLMMQIFFIFFSFNLRAGTLSSLLKIKFFAKVLC